MNWKYHQVRPKVERLRRVSMKNELKEGTPATNAAYVTTKYQWRMNWKVSPSPSRGKGSYICINEEWIERVVPCLSSVFGVLKYQWRMNWKWRRLMRIGRTHTRCINEEWIESRVVCMVGLNKTNMYQWRMNWKSNALATLAHVNLFVSMKNELKGLSLHINSSYGEPCINEEWIERVVVHVHLLALSFRINEEWIESKPALLGTPRNA